MAAPILWAPGQIALFLQENLLAHKIFRFRGGGGHFGFGGGGSADFILMGAGISLTNILAKINRNFKAEIWESRGQNPQISDVKNLVKFWGGDFPMLPISLKFKGGIDHILFREDFYFKIPP